MAYTTHGQHIPTTSTENPPSEQMDCGGPERCAICSRESVLVIMIGSSVEAEILAGDRTANYQDRALSHVRNYIEALWKTSDEESPTFDLYIVWFTKTLQNWKALVGSTLNDGFYYEVIYNGDKRETYIDHYMKFNNVVIKD